MTRQRTARMRRRGRLAGLRFLLSIDLFIDHMHTGTHLARALRETADIVDDPGVLTAGEKGGVRDISGITVGHWEVTDAQD
jgi:hypothetical protein